MNTITNNKLTDERVSNATLIRLIQWAEQHNSHYVAAALCELQERRKADSEPAGYHVIKECGKVGCSVATLEEAEKTRDFWNKKWIIKPYFYAPPVQETGVYKDMLNIINLLENNEWAEHCTGTVLGSLLESEITRLVSKEQSAPVVPDGLRQALSNAGIAAPESDEMLAATCEKYIQLLVTWVKDRKPFQPVPVVPEKMSKHALFEVAIARFSKMNEGFPIKRFKADWVISWMLENFPPVAQKQGDN
ncbi:hypothetical protein [Salmonella enterica]|uniref:Eaa protein n=2 Tax=Salmonella enterica TaxID=28901 RepID=A0A3F3IZ24_SALER|nr:hypothetical protein [Salmonella enterica]OHG26167.1 hypothetical protein A7T58_24705 [Salmonella enterica subsp. diarizonae serovar 16:z10:e,n,x,z15]OHG29794.1 hypothetical protein A7T60_24100 [Salmonella enterica subsp. diarizonae serovar 16:z10:e,n,x,z15]OHJ46083.1 hypothetical protein A7S51_24220 [Salmonella enterica]